MQPLLQKATIHLKRRGNVGALGVMTWVVGTNAGATLRSPYLLRWTAVDLATTPLRFR
jgi:hypothetical protein